MASLAVQRGPFYPDLSTQTEAQRRLAIRACSRPGLRSQPGFHASQRTLPAVSPICASQALSAHLGETRPRRSCKATPPVERLRPSNPPSHRNTLSLEPTPGLRRGKPRTCERDNVALTQQQSPIYAARLTVRGPSSSDIDRAAVEGVLSLPCVRDFVQGPLFVRGPSAQVVAAKVFLKRAALRAEQRGWAGMFDPAQAYAADRLWQAAPLRRLVRSKVRLAGGGVSPDGRISLGAAVRASVEPWLPGRGACGAEPACAEARRCTPSARPARAHRRAWRFIKAARGMRRSPASHCRTGRAALRSGAKHASCSACAPAGRGGPPTFGRRHVRCGRCQVRRRRCSTSPRGSHSRSHPSPCAPVRVA
jgi:hypothetical protein